MKIVDMMSDKITNGISLQVIKKIALILAFIMIWSVIKSFHYEFMIAIVIPVLANWSFGFTCSLINRVNRLYSGLTKSVEDCALPGISLAMIDIKSGHHLEGENI